MTEEEYEQEVKEANKCFINALFKKIRENVDSSENLFIDFKDEKAIETLNLLKDQIDILINVLTD